MWLRFYGMTLNWEIHIFMNANAENKCIMSHDVLASNAVFIIVGLGETVCEATEILIELGDRRRSWQMGRLRCQGKRGAKHVQLGLAPGRP